MDFVAFLFAAYLREGHLQDSLSLMMVGSRLKTKPRRKVLPLYKKEHSKTLLPLTLLFSNHGKQTDHQELQLQSLRLNLLHGKHIYRFKDSRMYMPVNFVDCPVHGNKILEGSVEVFLTLFSSFATHFHFSISIIKATITSVLFCLS